MLDRKKAPKASMLAPSPLPAFKTVMLGNGTEVHMLQHGTVEVAEVQIVFKTGTAYQDKVGQARYTASNMSEATASYTNQQLAEKLDDYGAWISNDTAQEFISMNLTSLERHLPHTLPLLHEVLFAPAFPEDEFTNMKIRNMQKLQVESKRKTYLSRKEFGHQLFGQDHPSGAALGPRELKQLQLADLHSFYQKHLQPGNWFITVVGRFDEENVLKQLEELFGTQTLQGNGGLISRAATTPILNGTGRHLVREEGMQSAITVGHLGFKRSHPHFDEMTFVNTLLGGFFGSRLMKNIREDKGYTYGIRSGWVAGKHTGYLIIASEVGNEYAENTIDEIRKEMSKLRVDLCSTEEMDLVKNYMLGSSISERETPFQLGSLIRFSVIHDISFDQLNQKYANILKLKPYDVLKLASEHLQPDNLLEVICGSPI